MIVPMKRVFILLEAKDAQGALSSLRAMGLLHIEHQQPPRGEDINLLQNNFSMVGNALEILSGNEEFKAPSLDKKESLADWKGCAHHIIELQKRLSYLENYARTLKSKIEEWRQWGDFDPQQIKALEKNNIFIGFYRIPLREMYLLPKTVAVEKIFIKSGVAHCMITSLGKVQVPFKEIPLPTASLTQMQRRLEEQNKVVNLIKAELKKEISSYPALFEKKQQLQKELEFHQVLGGMGKTGEIVYVSGFAPAETEGILLKAARGNQWGVLVREPSAEDNVPVLIRNPAWIAIIRPIFKFLEILPGYRELDISLLFLIFFSIFFGVLIGDAGYGLVYILITFLLQRKARKKKLDTGNFFIFYILSFCAIIWGVLTGTFFGQEWVLKAGYKPLAPALTDEKGLQRFCFFLGALHLSIAHGWRLVLKAPSFSALGDLGWVCVLWSVFFIAKTLILGDAFPSFCIWLLISGVTLVIIFTNPRKNILKSAEEWVAWLVTLPLSFMSNFADVVSYIRLFAVGMAGVAIADAFNAMAAMIGKGNMFMIMLAAVIALIGNALGVVLGPVSVLVHGVRLNLLEFSGHMGLSWSGSPYKPLKE